MRTNIAKQVALGGMLAALSLAVVSLGGLIPLATYICSMLCVLSQYFVLRFCGKRVAWSWYGAVAVLSLLLSPDREAAGVFLVLGYYPMLKPKMDSVRFGWFVKLLFFNGMILLLYGLLLKILGLDVLAEENRELGFVGLLILMILSNVTFLLMDRLLGILAKNKW